MSTAVGGVVSSATYDGTFAATATAVCCARRVPTAVTSSACHSDGRPVPQTLALSSTAAITLLCDVHICAAEGTGRWWSAGAVERCDADRSTVLTDPPCNEITEIVYILCTTQALLYVQRTDALDTSTLPEPVFYGRLLMLVPRVDFFHSVDSRKTSDSVYNTTLVSVGNPWCLFLVVVDAYICVYSCTGLVCAIFSKLDLIWRQRKRPIDRPSIKLPSVFLCASSVVFVSACGACAILM